MKDYERYMNRQKLSETGMAKLVKLETEPQKKTEKRGRHVSQWLKYCGMAACLAVAFGVFALAILQGGVGIVPNPIANASATPAAEELYFNEDEMIPFTDEAISGATMKLEPMEVADIALLFGSSEDDFDGFKEDMGWGKFDMEYYRVDMSPDSNALRVLLRGDYVASGGEEDMLTSFAPVNTVWLDIYEGYSYINAGSWERFNACEINGHRVIAAYDENHSRAGAVFDVETGGKTYGVYYTVTTDGEEDARELVTKLVQRITKDGLYPEMYGVWDAPTLRYVELTEISPNRQVCDIKSDDISRELSGEELKRIFPAMEEEQDYQWRGDGLFHADGALRVLDIEGIRHDGSACMTITAGAEEDVFLLNSEIKDGKVTYVGTENQLWNGFELLRGYYRYAPNYYWWWDGETLDNACLVSFQSQQSSRDLCVEITTCMKKGTLEENKTFNQQWVNTILGKGLWFSRKEQNGKTVWGLPKVDKPVELLGSYQYVEMTDEGMVFCPVMMFYADGGFQCVSDLASSHICVGSFTVQNGRVTANCERHRYVFDVIDENNLRFVAEGSDEMPRYIGPKVTDGAVFRRELDDEGNIVTPDGVPVIYDQSGSKVSYDRIKSFVYKTGEEISWKDQPVGDGEHIIAWNQADTAGERMKEGGSVWVWGETTHHPEPSDHVEVTHHADEHHSDKHH